MAVAAAASATNASAVSPDAASGSEVAGSLHQDVAAGVNSDPSDAPPEATDDELLAALADDMHTFGGLYLDADGRRVNVWLTAGVDAERATQARDAAARVLSQSVFLGREVHPRKADYSWRALFDWRERLDDPSIDYVFADMDESLNRIVLGVEHADVRRDAVLLAAGKLGVPSEALHVVDSSPVLDDSSLRDTHRPPRGGLQIAWYNFAAGSSFGCTLGVPASRGGVPGFVTATHCSNRIGSGGDSTGYGQATGTQPIGTESHDGTWWTSADGYTCESGRVCRFADTNFVGHIVGIALRQGYIAWPAAEGTTAWDGTTERRIIGANNPTYNTLVAMVGKSSGRRTGTVRGTCLKVNQTYAALGKVAWRCMAYADYPRGAGDSGAPILRRDSGEVLDAHLKGIHKGGVTVGGVSYSLFSPTGNIKRSTEMGSTLRVCASGFGC